MEDTFIPGNSFVNDEINPDDSLPHATTPADLNVTDNPLSSESDDKVLELGRKRRSMVTDVGVALPETFGRLRFTEVDEPCRSLEIPISLDQAAMIATLFKQNTRSRPFLSDVAVDLLNQFQMGIALVTISGRIDGVYLAEVTVVDNQGRQRIVPARPSDAVLLALSCAVQPPIMIEETLYDQVVAS